MSLSVFQYNVTETTTSECHQNFRLHGTFNDVGVLSGPLMFQINDEWQEVGDFTAVNKVALSMASKSGGPAVPFNGTPTFPPQLPTPQRVEIPRNRVSPLNVLYYVPNFISEAEEDAMFQALHSRDFADMGHRSTQEWGTTAGLCPCERSLPFVRFPDFLMPLVNRLHENNIFVEDLYPMNSIRSNSYAPGQGIWPHCDGPVYFPKVAIIGLKGHVLFNFYEEEGTEDTHSWNEKKGVPDGYKNGKAVASLFCEPRSLMIFYDDTFRKHRHGIDFTEEDEIQSHCANLDLLETKRKVGDKVPRPQVRTSLTCRHMLPRCQCPSLDFDPNIPIDSK